MPQTGATANLATTFKGAEYARWYEQAPQEQRPGMQTWYTRGQSMIVAYTEADVGAKLARDAQPDEYMLLLPSKDSVVQVTAGDQSKTVPGYSVVVVPPGRS
ncbi:MAG: hypothetical protein JWQ17_1160 [Tardiphaga sp.]|nr:hypothetical protein [Tardiphaga sp.]